MARLCKTLYDFESTHVRTLGFREGEKLLIVNVKNNDPNWWYASNQSGAIGYVPRSYVTFEEVSNERLLQEIEKIVQALQHIICTNSSQLSPKHHFILRELVDLKNELANDLTKLESIKAKSNGSDTFSSKSAYNSVPNSPGVNETCKSLVKGTQLKSEPLFCNVSTQTIRRKDQNPLNDIDIPTTLVAEMVEKIRNNTQLSYQLSILSVANVLESMKNHIPRVETICNKLLVDLEDHRTNYRTIYKSQDKRRLREIFEHLWSCKNDEQQRSWPIFEDESVIGQLLNDMNSILNDADPRICCEVVKEEDYEAINMLVTYYQMEPRRKLRFLLLQVFESLCRIDEQVIENLLMSVLPMELTREIQHHSSDHERFVVSAKMLTIILGVGHRPPRSIYDHLNKDFSLFLLNGIESVLDGRVEEDVANFHLSILLAMNLHLSVEDNFIIDALTGQRDATALTEKLMLLINREEDPVCILQSSVEMPNSVLKFLVDLFSDTICAKHFYVNDIKVLIDIILRQLTDLTPGTERRNDYQKLLLALIENTDYADHMHQKDNLRVCFSSILEDEEFHKTEKDIVYKTVVTFPNLFT